MTVFQIVATCILSLGALVSMGFTLAFVVESCTKERVKSTKSVEKINNDEEISEIDLDAMLAKLEEASKKKVEEKTPVVEKVEEQPIVVKPAEEPVIVEEEPEEVLDEEDDDVEEFLNIPVVKELPKKMVAEPIITEVKKVSDEKRGPEFDYRVRLAKIKESQGKIDRDLEKTTRAILKYERTIRRKERNQKMLDRRALELTNLNLLMYSVTDIKNVDAEKKTRQEELTAHISELKASIQDAENYLEANKEKHENNIKLSEYLTHEKTRYADEVKELEALIAAGKYFDNKDGNNN